MKGAFRSGVNRVRMRSSQRKEDAGSGSVMRSHKPGRRGATGRCRGTGRAGERKLAVVLWRGCCADSARAGAMWFSALAGRRMRAPAMGTPRRLLPPPGTGETRRHSEDASIRCLPRPKTLALPTCSSPPQQKQGRSASGRASHSAVPVNPPGPVLPDLTRGVAHPGRRLEIDPQRLAAQPIDPFPDGPVVKDRGRAAQRLVLARPMRRRSARYLRYTERRLTCPGKGACVDPHETLP